MHFFDIFLQLLELRSELIPIRYKGNLQKYFNNTTRVTRIQKIFIKKLKTISKVHSYFLYYQIVHFRRVSKTSSVVGAIHKERRQAKGKRIKLSTGGMGVKNAQNRAHPYTMFNVHVDSFLDILTPLRGPFY